MKTLIRSILLVGAMLVASSAFAAHSDMFLQIKAVNGVSRVVPCPDGACTVADLAPGEYTVSVCTADGKALPAEEMAKHTITSPRDPASGQATGKRQHKPISVTKEWSASSPLLRILIDEPGSSVTLKCSLNTTRSNIK